MWKQSSAACCNKMSVLVTVLSTVSPCDVTHTFSSGIWMVAQSTKRDKDQTTAKPKVSPPLNDWLPVLMWKPSGPFSDPRLLPLLKTNRLLPPKFSIFPLQCCCSSNTALPFVSVSNTSWTACRIADVFPYALKRSIPRGHRGVAQKANPGAVKCMQICLIVSE